MSDYIYTLRQNDSPNKRLYVIWHGAQTANIPAQAKHGFEELFYPAAKDWREKAVKDADQAFSGILKAEGYIT